MPSSTLPGQNIDPETLAAIGEIASRFKTKIFPGFVADDIEQEVVIMMVEALPRYRPEMGKIEHFLSSHARRRLANLRRNRHQRPLSDCGCQPCLRADEQGEPGPHDGAFCDKYLS